MRDAHPVLESLCPCSSMLRRCKAQGSINVFEQGGSCSVPSHWHDVSTCCQCLHHHVLHCFDKGRLQDYKVINHKTWVLSCTANSRVLVE